MGHCTVTLRSGERCSSFLALTERLQNISRIGRRPPLGNAVLIPHLLKTRIQQCLSNPQSSAIPHMHLILPGVFGNIHRHVSALRQRFSGLGVLRIERHSDAARYSRCALR